MPYLAVSKEALEVSECSSPITSFKGDGSRVPGTVDTSDDETARQAVKAVSRSDSHKAPSPAWTEPKPPARRRRPSGVESPARLFGFTDPEDIKTKVREAIVKKKVEYSVHVFYYETGCFQWIAKHQLFENVTLFVIALNAIYIAVDTDWNKERPLEAMASRDLESSPLPWRVMEYAFCAYFTMELTIRFAAFAKKCNCCRDGWFVFDTLLVLLMVLETWILPGVRAATGWSLDAMGNTGVLRLFRLLRLSRLLRMLKSLPELMILIRGMVAAVSSVFYVMCLLVAITYVFAIMMTQLAVDTQVGDMYFASVPLAMYSLFIHVTFMDDLAQFTNDLKDEMWPLLALSLVFVVIGSLTLMNMLVGVLCEVVSAVAVTEREELHANIVMDKMQHILHSLDENSDKRISYAEFSMMIEKPEALRCLQDVGVNPLHVIDFADLFFFEGGQPIELTFEEFMDVVLDLRESNQATVKDLRWLWCQIKNSTNTTLTRVEQKVDSLSQRLETTASDLSRKIDSRYLQLQKTMEEQNSRMQAQMATILAEVQKGGNQPLRYQTDSPVVAVAGTVRRAPPRGPSKGPWDKVSRNWGDGA
eukprot:gb/GFBE01075610.1/.p1 GENE.gb/GFBE01075610.1/~~gb/GFBE01075610.1/.p1  ORF type:complete len:589 (+),score=133.58 gb/GFBE01075610.1/:1-1767(+)